MELKCYQKERLATLAGFFRDGRVGGPKAAYESIVNEPAQKARLGRYAGAYRALEAVPLAPYVCLRLPTGGGKTLLAARAVSVARDSWIERDYPLVVWLLATNTIFLPTLVAVKNTPHAYKQGPCAHVHWRAPVFSSAPLTLT